MLTSKKNFYERLPTDILRGETLLFSDSRDLAALCIALGCEFDKINTIWDESKKEYFKAILSRLFTSHENLESAHYQASVFNLLKFHGYPLIREKGFIEKLMPQWNEVINSPAKSWLQRKQLANLIEAIEGSSEEVNGIYLVGVDHSKGVPQIILDSASCDDFENDCIVMYSTISQKIHRLPKQGREKLIEQCIESKNTMMSSVILHFGLLGLYMDEKHIYELAKNIFDETNFFECYKAHMREIDAYSLSRHYNDYQATFGDKTVLNLARRIAYFHEKSQSSGDKTLNWGKYAKEFFEQVVATIDFELSISLADLPGLSRGLFSRFSMVDCYEPWPSKLEDVSRFDGVNYLSFQVAMTLFPDKFQDKINEAFISLQSSNEAVGVFTSLNLYASSIEAADSVECLHGWIVPSDLLHDIISILPKEFYCSEYYHYHCLSILLKLVNHFTVKDKEDLFEKIMGPLQSTFLKPLDMNNLEQPLNRIADIHEFFGLKFMICFTDEHRIETLNLFLKLFECEDRAYEGHLHRQVLFFLMDILPFFGEPVLRNSNFIRYSADFCKVLIKEMEDYEKYARARIDLANNFCEPLASTLNAIKLFVSEEDISTIGDLLCQYLIRCTSLALALDYDWRGFNHLLHILRGMQALTLSPRFQKNTVENHEVMDIIITQAYADTLNEYYVLSLPLLHEAFHNLFTSLATGRESVAVTQCLAGKGFKMFDGQPWRPLVPLSEETTNAPKV